VPPRKLAVHPRSGVEDGVLVLNGFTGYEAISRPFHFQLQCIAENSKKVKFEALLGNVVSIQMQLPGGLPTWITGLCNKVSQGARGKTFTNYSLDLVPEFWFLSRKTNSRIFQHMKVSDILRQVLDFKHTSKVISYRGEHPEEPREFCVQYRESDFAFASRLMEEEGYHYYFDHEYLDSAMHVSNSPKSSFPDLKPKGPLIYEPVRGGTRPDDRVLSWEKSQELKSRMVTLWDHAFELPHKHLEAEHEIHWIQAPVQAGKSQHHLGPASDLTLKLYDYPGGYAKRFDGINKSGGEQPEKLKKIFEDNRRTAELRMGEEAAASILVSGSSSVRQLVSGREFHLEGHFEGDGDWVLYEIEHVASEAANVRSGRGGFRYENHFTCFPADLPFRPPRVTPRPVVGGTQTAVVVGPKGEEVFTDKYGRIKVQFHWDREGEHDIDSSCWIRVAQPIAGRRWGSSFWPRIGQEVVVDFLEGDPDRPIVIGSVYNADQRPPYLGDSPDPKHKNDNRLMGVKSNTTLGGEGFNEWRFDDTKGKEQIFLHAARNMDTRVRSNSMESVGGSKHLTVGGMDEQGSFIGDFRELVHRNRYINVFGDHQERVGGAFYLGIGGAEAGGPREGCFGLYVDDEKLEEVRKDSHYVIGGNQTLDVHDDVSVTIGGSRNEKIEAKHALDAGEEIHLKSGMKIVIEADAQLSLKVGSNFIDISPAGVAIQGKMVLINSPGGTPASGSGSHPDEDQEEYLVGFEEIEGDPTPADDAKAGFKSSS
jgi:type VI secretion system secreted protein VgrG